MINQRYCPYCKSPARTGCSHLALAAEARDFVRRCVEKCQGEAHWRALCQQQTRRPEPRSAQQEDFMWLETAFCDEFLKGLSWFGGLDHEWRSGPRPEQGGFWVLLWSKNPERLWWELLEEIERRTTVMPVVQQSAPWLIWLNPR